MVGSVQMKEDECLCRGVAHVKVYGKNAQQYVKCGEKVDYKTKTLGCNLFAKWEDWKMMVTELNRLERPFAFKESVPKCPGHRLFCKILISKKEDSKGSAYYLCNAKAPDESCSGFVAWVNPPDSFLGSKRPLTSPTLNERYDLIKKKIEGSWMDGRTDPETGVYTALRYSTVNHTLDEISRCEWEVNKLKKKLQTVVVGSEEDRSVRDQVERNEDMIRQMKAYLEADEEKRKTMPCYELF